MFYFEEHQGRTEAILSVLPALVVLGVQRDNFTCICTFDTESAWNRYTAVVGGTRRGGGVHTFCSVVMLNAELCKVVVYV